MKWEIANRFTQALGANAKFSLDISVDAKDLIPGEKWHAFIEDSRFCLTTPSGSSLRDPSNKIRVCVNKYLAKRPEASFEDIERHCFPGQDRLHMFTAISPRNIEAALAETVQIATPGAYSGLLSPFEHYIPLNDDCSNIKEVVNMMADQRLVDSVKLKCKEKILSESRLRRAVIVNEIVQLAENVVSYRNIIGSNQLKMDLIIETYDQYIENVARNYWMKRKIVTSLKAVARRMGARRIRDLLFDNA